MVQRILKRASGIITGTGAGHWDAMADFLGVGRNRYPETFVVFEDGGTFYAQNGDSGDYTFSGADLVTVLESCLASAGTTFVRQGAYTFASQLDFQAQETALEFEAGTTISFTQAGYAIAISGLNRCRIFGRPQILVGNASTGVLLMEDTFSSEVELGRIGNSAAAFAGQVGVQMQRSGPAGYCFLNKVSILGAENLDEVMNLTIGANGNVIEAITRSSGGCNTGIAMTDASSNFIRVHIDDTTQAVNGIEVGGASVANRFDMYFEDNATGTMCTWGGTAANNRVVASYLSGVMSNPLEPPLGNQIITHNNGGIRSNDVTYETDVEWFVWNGAGWSPAMDLHWDAGLVPPRAIAQFGGDIIIDGVSLTVGTAAAAATTGYIRLPNDVFINWRDNAGAADVFGIKVDANDVLVLGGVGVGVLLQGASELRFRQNTEWISSKDVGHLDLDAAVSIDFNDTVELAQSSNQFRTPDLAGVSWSIQTSMPIIAGGGANNELSVEWIIDTIELAGLHAETDGAGSYRDPVFMIPYLTIAGPGAANPNLPTGATNGAMVVQHNIAGGSDALYVYSNGAWVSTALT